MSAAFTLSAFALIRVCKHLAGRTKNYIVHLADLPTLKRNKPVSPGRRKS